MKVPEQSRCNENFQTKIFLETNVYDAARKNVLFPEKDKIIS
jgi:hypothetical protein